MGIISEAAINCVENENPWSIDFPSWYDEFNLERGKKFFIIGSEPHIHHKYLQTVYGLNGEKDKNHFVHNGHPIFKFVTEILSHRLSISMDEVLSDCYITDLFPMSPLRSKNNKVGSSDKIQDLIGNSDSWERIQKKYADKHLKNEILAVKPEIIITQGKSVFEKVIKILNIKDKTVVTPIVPKKGKRRQFLRRNNWNGIPILSAPHIGSRRFRTFWNQNLEAIKSEFKKL